MSAPNIGVSPEIPFLPTFRDPRDPDKMNLRVQKLPTHNRPQPTKIKSVEAVYYDGSTKQLDWSEDGTDIHISLPPGKPVAEICWRLEENSDLDRNTECTLY